MTRPSLTYINLDAFPHQDPAFYLGVEEYYLKTSDSEYFLVWSCKPSVIIGKHQILANEIDLDYLQQEGISIARRFSGGGAVYADEHNLMYTFILNTNSKAQVFSEYLAKICEVFKSQYGLDVTYSGRNDLLLNGQKISGSSFYFYQNRLIFHGTLLYDVDLDKMSHVLHPNKIKLLSKGIQSVSQRVCNLKDYINVPLSSIKKSLITAFCTNEIKVLPLAVIYPYQQALLNKEYIQGKKKQYNYHNQLNFKGGNIACDLLIKDGKIRDLAFSGDFFMLKDDDILIKGLINIPYEKKEICDIVKASNISSCILEMDTATFTTLLVGGELKHE